MIHLSCYGPCWTWTYRKFIGRFWSGPFWSMDRFDKEWAVLDVAVGRLCPSCGPFWFMGLFGMDPFVIMYCTVIK